MGNVTTHESKKSFASRAHHMSSRGAILSHPPPIHHPAVLGRSPHAKHPHGRSHALLSRSKFDRRISYVNASRVPPESITQMSTLPPPVARPNALLRRPNLGLFHRTHEDRGGRAWPPHFPVK